MLKGKPKKVIIAGYADWNTKTTAQALRDIGCDVKTFGAQKPNGSKADASIGYVQVRLPFLRKLANRAFSHPRSLYQNRHIWHLFDCFDRKTSQAILTYKPDYTILCSTMAEKSLKASKDVGAKSILLQGSSPLEFFEKYMSEANDPNRRIGYNWKRKQKIEFKAADLIIVESEFVKKDCVKLGIQFSKICVIPPHIKETTRTNRQSPEPVIFGSIQVGFGKGSENLLQWWNSSIKIDAPLYLLGKVDSLWKQKISRSQADIRSFGYIQGDEYAEAMNAISVAVFPTYSDGGPRSLFECMAFGHCPIVSERCAGADHIENGRTGFVIPLNESDKWCETITWCAHNSHEVQRIGEKAKQYVEAHLGQRNLVSRWQDVLDGLEC